MILTDGKHVVSTKDRKELHDWAQVVRLSRSFYHGEHNTPHYTLPPKFRGRHLQGYETVPTTRDLVRMTRGASTAAVEDEGNGGKRVSRRYKCDYCNAPLDAHHKYLYPPPNPVDPFLGKRACPACAPEQELLQVEQGLVIPVQPTTVRR